MLAYAVLPAVAAATLAATLHPLGQATWERWGYVLSPAGVRILNGSLTAIALLTVITAVVLAWRAYLRGRDFVGAAAQVDEAVGGHQQILTFATLVDPAAPEAATAGRSPLFPLLWKRAISFLDTFDASGAFPFRLGRPVRRSSVLTLAIAIAMVLATLSLVRAPSPLQIEAMKLRESAGEIEKSSAAGPGDLALASSLRDAADALENPKLPPEQKLKRLKEVMQQVASRGEQGKGKEKGQGGGGTVASKEGKSQGTGQGAGSANGSGQGSAHNQASTGAGQNDKGDKGKDNSIELQNELAKAEAQVEEAKSPEQSPSSGGDHNKGEAPEVGKGTNQKAAGNQPNPQQAGNTPMQGANATRNLPQAAGNNQQAGTDQGSNQGDTRLGEFPTPTKTQRFSKGGSDALSIHDARYVMFRLPSATPVGSGGTTVVDPNRTKATTPYVNAPLKETSSDAPPDERQLVPPRYRDLIH
ncbi:MAG TPA: hypothetical protein VKB29_10765 [Candidatus Binataceae bacterium]|nr:hypothetical protein [Candidatus Binataceae bacterium]